MAMEITVNGERRNHSSPLTMGGLLQLLKIDPRSVVVERNLTILARSRMESEALEEGDSIEIIRFVGGG
jgi:thiamine biosynthesis protein ThiS